MQAAQRRRIQRSIAAEAWESLQPFLRDPDTVSGSATQQRLFLTSGAAVSRLQPDLLRDHINKMLQSPIHVVAHAAAMAFSNVANNERSLDVTDVTDRQTQVFAEIAQLTGMQPADVAIGDLLRESAAAQVEQGRQLGANVANVESSELRATMQAAQTDSQSSLILLAFVNAGRDVDENRTSDIALQATEEFLLPGGLANRIAAARGGDVDSIARLQRFIDHVMLPLPGLLSKQIRIDLADVMLPRAAIESDDRTRGHALNSLAMLRDRRAVQPALYATNDVIRHVASTPQDRPVALGIAAEAIPILAIANTSECRQAIADLAHSLDTRSQEGHAVVGVLASVGDPAIEALEMLAGDQRLSVVTRLEALDFADEFTKQLPQKFER
jgi:hypothetical protein